LDENQELEERFAQLTEDLRKNNIQEFRNDFLEMHIYEQGQFYQSLSEEERQ
jgi:magnesium transporter